jgi:glutamyl-tRNA synthetase
MKKTVRVRFAPSPTGALHIGGLRTALYNYLLARQNGGQFIVRIEDTDQTRFVAGAEDYIMEALNWLGLSPDESPVLGGTFAPYRQSDRKPIYRQYAEQLIKNGKAYYAFDTEEELKQIRAEEEAKGNKGFRYNAYATYPFRNSITLSETETADLLAQHVAYVIRLRVTPDETIHFNDLIRGHIQYSSNEVDDKVLLKSDGMPTYHLANVVDDYLMQISHVIRGEEWLPSTPTHVLLYRGFGWETSMPEFAHLPLILRPDGKGKLSKRDGAKFGIPVFPLDFTLPNVTGDDAFIKGFREWGFEPAAVVNFLALQGWSDNSNREFFSLTELVDIFKIENINKAGTRFDFDKAKWFNQQYLMSYDNETLAAKTRPFLPEKLQTQFSDVYLSKVANALKERVYFLADYYNEGKYFFQQPDFENQDLQTKIAKETNEGKKRDLSNALKTNQDNIKKLVERYSDLKAALLELKAEIAETNDFTETHLHDLVTEFIQKHQLKTKEIMAYLRLAMSGQMQGTSVFEMMAIFEKEETLQRLERFSVFLNAANV